MPAKTKPVTTSSSIAFVSDENPLRLNITDIEILREQLREATDLDFKRFIRVCERTRLDPITRQIYGRVQNEKVKGRQGQADTWKKSLVIITGIDGFRALAAHTGEYEGQTKPEWYYSKLGQEPEWHEAFVPSTDTKGNPIEVPEVARVGVWRRGFREACYGVANFEGFADYKKGEGNTWYLGTFWRKLGPHMIAKVAEAQAFRKAFPQELGGIYIEEEVSDLTEEEREAAEVHRAAENASQEPANRAPKVEKPAPPATKPAAEKPAPVAEKPAPEPEKPAPKGKPAGYVEAAQDPLFADEDGGKTAAAPKANGYTLKVINNGAYRGKKLSDLSDTQLATLKLVWADKFRAKSPEHGEESEQIEAELGRRPDSAKTTTETRAALIKAGQLK